MRWGDLRVTSLHPTFGFVSSIFLLSFFCVWLIAILAWSCSFHGLAVACDTVHLSAPEMRFLRVCVCVCVSVCVCVCAVDTFRCFFLLLLLFVLQHFSCRSTYLVDSGARFGWSSFLYLRVYLFSNTTCLSLALASLTLLSCLSKLSEGWHRFLLMVLFSSSVLACHQKPKQYSKEKNELLG